MGIPNAEGQVKVKGDLSVNRKWKFLWNSVFFIHVWIILPYLAHLFVKKSSY